LTPGGDSVKKFALISLSDLKTRYFDHKEDLESAISVLVGRGIDFIPLRYHSGAGAWNKFDMYS
jgi:hypothetical protein